MTLFAVSSWIMQPKFTSLHVCFAILRIYVVGMFFCDLALVEIVVYIVYAKSS